MEWAGLAIQVSLCGAACAVGWRLGRGRWALPLAVLTVGMILLRALFRFLPEAEYPLLHVQGYSLIRAGWVFPFALLCIGIGLTRMTGLAWRLSLGAIAALVLVVATSTPLTRATFEHDDYIGTPDAEGICLQTQDYTCGAAATATLLARNGIRTDEAEMALLCGSTPITGTDEIAICSALRQKLAGSGWSVAIERPTSEALAFRHAPALARIRASTFRDHWVVLLAVDGPVAVVADPLMGKVKWPMRDFQSQWRGLLVTVNRPAAGPAFAVR